MASFAPWFICSSTRVCSRSPGGWARCWRTASKSLHRPGKRRGRCWSFPCPCTRSSSASEVSTMPNVGPCGHGGDALPASSMGLHLQTSLLKRVRVTVSQAGLTSHQRRQNLRGAFFAPLPGRLAGQHVLLVDDIYTTGATARACSRVLMNAGAASVRVATVARAQRKGVASWDPGFLRTDSSRRQGRVWKIRNGGSRCLWEKP